MHASYPVDVTCCMINYYQHSADQLVRLFITQIITITERFTQHFSLSLKTPTFEWMNKIIQKATTRHNVLLNRPNVTPINVHLTVLYYKKTNFLKSLKNLVFCASYSFVMIYTLYYFRSPMNEVFTAGFMCSTHYFVYIQSALYFYVQFKYSGQFLSGYTLHPFSYLFLPRASTLSRLLWWRIEPFLHAIEIYYEIIKWQIV